eukprot:scaffold12768_cov104-Isochrysis_galbana.AAC.1
MSSDLVKLQSPDLDAILPILVVGVDGATAATVEKRNEQRRHPMPHVWAQKRKLHAHGGMQRDPQTIYAH